MNSLVELELAEERTSAIRARGRYLRQGTWVRTWIDACSVAGKSVFDIVAASGLQFTWRLYWSVHWHWLSSVSAASFLCTMSNVVIFMPIIPTIISKIVVCI